MFCEYNLLRHHLTQCAKQFYASWILSLTPLYYVLYIYTLGDIYVLLILSYVMVYMYSEKIYSGNSQQTLQI